jgi:acetoacetyl-CoA synthetase
VTALTCTPSYALYLAEFVRERFGMEPAQLGLRRIMVGAEPGGGIPAVRQKISDDYGALVTEINRGGVRMGTAEIYSAVEKVQEVRDSLVVDLHRPDGSAFMPLFVVLEEGAELDEDLANRIKRSIRENASPRHVPDEVLAVPEVPRTLNGKKLEVPVKKILSGTPPEEAASRDSLSNPESLDRFAELAGKF